MHEALLYLAFLCHSNLFSQLTFLLVSSLFPSSRILWSINSNFIEVKAMLMLQIIKFPSYIYFKLHGYTCIVHQCHSIHAFSYENFNYFNVAERGESLLLK